jgi:hypothetical protein
MPMLRSIGPRRGLDCMNSGEDASVVAWRFLINASVDPGVDLDETGPDQRSRKLAKVQLRLRSLSSAFASI